MHITIVTAGSIGDVQPYVALGLGLQQRGYRARIATNTRFEAFVLSRGLEFCKLRFHLHDLVPAEAGQAMMERGRFLVQHPRIFFDAFGRFIEQGVRDCLEACADTNAIITSLTGLPLSYHIAEKYCLPLIQAYLVPVTSTRAFPIPASPSYEWFGSTLNRLSYFVSEQSIWRLLRPFVNASRRKVLNLPPLSPQGLLSKLNQERSPVLYGFSSSIIPKPADWGEWIHVTGYWFLDHDSSWQPTTELVDFLTSGPAPVYVGFGSMNTRDPKRTTELVMQALALSGQRGILIAGRGGLTPIDSSENVFGATLIPHDWLLSQVVIAVHHGGAGTTGACLRSGIPSIVVPFMTDQPFWGKQVTKLGVGKAPFAYKQLTAERLATAIEMVVSDTKIRKQAAVIGEAIRGEDGVACAVEIIQNQLAA